MGGQHPDDVAVPVLQRRGLYAPIACGGSDAAMRLERWVEFHVLDDDALPISHRLCAGRTLVYPNRAEMFEEVFPESTLGDDLQGMTFGVEELDVTEFSPTGHDGFLEHILQCLMEINGSQQASAEGVQPGRRFQFGGKLLLALTQRRFSLLTLRDIPGEASGVDERAVLPQHAGVDQHVLDRPVVAPESGRVLVRLCVKTPGLQRNRVSSQLFATKPLRRPLAFAQTGPIRKEETVMSENERKDEVGPESLPELEHRCSRCNGRGRWGSDGECGLCDGTGYELTEFGKKVMRLMHRRFRALLREISGD